MIAGKIILASLTVPEQSHLDSSRIRFNIIMNELLYDELEANHCKYFCLTNGDLVVLEIVENERKKLLGTVSLNNVCQMVLQNKKIDLEIYLSDYQTNISFTIIFEHIKKRKNPEPEVIITNRTAEI